MKSKKEYIVDFEEFECRCRELADIIKSNKHIKSIYGVPKGGVIVATRLSYLTGLPLTFIPRPEETVIIDDCIDSGATRHSFGNFKFFFPLIDKQYEEITEWIVFWYTKK